MQDVTKFLLYHQIPTLSHWPDILKRYPNGINNKPWDMIELYCNPSVSIDLLELYFSDISLDITKLSSREDLKWELVRRYPAGINGNPWNVEELSSNSSFDWEILRLHPYGLNGKAWNMEKLIRNRSFGWNIVDKYPDFPWDTNIISAYHGIDMNIVRKYPEGFAGIPWDMYKLSRQYNLNWDLIEQYPEGLGGIPWDMKGLSSNPLLDWNLLEQYPKGINGVPWDINELCLNQKLNWDFIRRHPDWLWSVNTLSRRYDNNIKLVEQHPEGLCGQPWDMEIIFHIQEGRKSLQSVLYREDVLTEDELESCEFWNSRIRLSYFESQMKNEEMDELDWNEIQISISHPTFDSEYYSEILHDLYCMSSQLFKDPISTFRRLPFATDQFKNELIVKADEILFQSGGYRYQEGYDRWISMTKI